MSFASNPRRALVAAGMAVATVALVASLGGTASAGAGCPEKTLCVWQDNEGGGEQVNIKADGISNKLAKKLNNGASSVINNRNKRAYLYDKRGGKGDKVCLDPGAEVADLGSFANFNDLASSSKNTDNKKDCPVL
jgi:Peptidase inhibitor family I36